MLDVDLGRLGAELDSLVEAGADRVQWDVMDGRFVPRLTHGPDLLRSVRGRTTIPFEAHLMIERPERHWAAFADAGADVVIVHAETTVHLHRLLGEIRASGAKAGVALNPSTPVDAIRHVVDLVDLALVMTVNPGWGGQLFIATMLAKVREIRDLLDAAGSPAEVEVDGGVSAAVAGEVVAHGANVLVAGSAVHRHPGGRAAAIDEIRSAARAAIARPAPAPGA
ncbi:MAG: ribulose-phosphate 3-epimerase [Chloroflexi bacterium RBG_16_72_14]|nr:MAG: ribulose-phosphate 3-epimerase [Chloroflexi bacterium RBG_16_72_14]